MSEIIIQPEWYENISFSEAKNLIHEKFSNMKRDYVAVGYYLRYVRDHELYLDGGYDNFYDFADQEYGMKKSTANHCIRINEEFSKNGNSPILDKRFGEFSKSQLQELLYVPEEKRDEVTPEMTVKEIREVGKPRLDVEPEQEEAADQMDESDCPEFVPEEPVSILGYPKRVYPEGSLIAIPGCGKQNCFSCHRDGCDLRQEYCYCVEAPMGNPFPCTTLNVVDNLREEIGSRCQFVNLDLADIIAGDGQPVPCCKKCANPCGYECRRSTQKRAKAMSPDRQEEQIKLPERWGNIPEEECATSHKDIPEEVAAKTAAEMPEVLTNSSENITECCENAADVQDHEECADEIDEQVEYNPLFVKDVLSDKENELNQYLQCNKESAERGEKGLPVLMIMRQRAIVAGLKLLLEQMECVEEEPESEEELTEQPELPLMKNNDQRKEWLRNYKSWGLWYEDEHIGARFYKYEFENGARLIAEEYSEEETEWSPGRDHYYLHLVGGPDPKKHPKYGFRKWPYHETYNKFPDSETELMEFLKEVQRK